jgi:bifunctional non-homologous end joining protein LigD
MIGLLSIDAKEIDRQKATGVPKRPDVRPDFIPPMQCKLVDQLPSGKEWLYELKLDGYRALAIKVGARVQLISRNQKDLTRAYPRSSPPSTPSA